MSGDGEDTRSKTQDPRNYWRKSRSGAPPSFTTDDKTPSLPRYVRRLAPGPPSPAPGVHALVVDLNSSQYPAHPRLRTGRPRAKHPFGTDETPLRSSVRPAPPGPRPLGAPWSVGGRTRESGGWNGEPQRVGEKAGGKETRGENQGARLAHSGTGGRPRKTRCHFDPLPARGRRSYIGTPYHRDHRSWPHRSRHEHYDWLGRRTKKDATDGGWSYPVAPGPGSQTPGRGGRIRREVRPPIREPRVRVHWSCNHRLGSRRPRVRCEPRRPGAV